MLQKDKVKVNVINMRRHLTATLYGTYFHKVTFTLKTYLPEEEIVELDIAVIGSGDCSFHPLDKLLLCLNIHFWDLKANVCLYFVSFKSDHIQTSILNVHVLKQ